MLGHKNRRLLEKAPGGGMLKLALVVVALLLVVAHWPHESAVFTESVARGVQVFFADLARSGHQ